MFKNNRNQNNMAWREVNFIRPFDIAAVYEALTNLATTTHLGRIVWEVRSNVDRHNNSNNGSGIRYYLGADKRFIREIENVFKAHLNVQIRKIDAEAISKHRQPVTMARRIKTTKPLLSLKTDSVLSATRAMFAVLVQAKPGEELVLQIILGSSFTPIPVSNNPSDPHSSWIDIITGAVKTADGDSKASMRDKMSYHGFNAIVRIGVRANTEYMAQSYIYTMLGALRTLESVGVKLTNVTDKPNSLDEYRVPFHAPNRLSIRELANFLTLPIGDETLPGIGGVHPKLLLPPKWLKAPQFENQKRSFGVTTDSRKVPLNISPTDSLEHTILLGPTGSGKSTAMLNLIMADINAGRSVLVIDPKADLVNDVLRRIPEKRVGDVVVIDPSDSRPVGFNPLHADKRKNNSLVAESILAVFKEIFADNWGIRSQDILTGALLTLAQVKGSTLVMLPSLLTDESFRRKIVGQLTDTVGLLPFWEGYESMSKAERNQTIAPVLNKLRQFILRPELRNILAQSEPAFSLSDLFHKRKIVLVPLNRGIIGAENARLLGSLIVGLTWTLALGRASIPAERRHIIEVYIDELQDYIALPTNISDALAQARGMNVSITLAHQYRAQLTPEVRAGIDANARNKVVFGLNASDARDMAIQAPELTAEDFMLLPRFGVYTNMQVGGNSTGWISGKTNPASPVIRETIEARAVSQEHYGRDGCEVEEEYLRAIGRAGLNGICEIQDGNTTQKGGHDAIGRKKKA